MRHLRQVGNHSVTANIFAQCNRQFALGGFEFGRIQNLTQTDRSRHFIRHFNTNRRFIRDRCFNTHAGGCQTQRNIIGKAGDFTDFDNYASSIFGKLNGFATDIGVNYQWKDRLDDDNESYKLNVGLAVRNIGSMTFKDANNQSTNYILNVPDGEFLDLNQFQDVSSLEDIEQLLLASGYLNSVATKRDFKTKLPTAFSAYADVKVIPNFFVTVYGQQKLNEDDANDQITTQNVISVTPRYTAKKFEVYSPLASNEISGFTAGLGFGVGGFFIGSSSILTALGNGDQADIYLGLRLGLQ